MSHTATTQHAPQWAIDAQTVIIHEFQMSTKNGALRDQDDDFFTVDLATIIARHAPKPESPSELELYQTGSQIIRNAQSARIAVLEQREKELEADNARLREGFQRIRALLKAGRFPDAMFVCVTTGSDAPIIVAQD